MKSPFPRRPSASRPPPIPGHAGSGLFGIALAHLLASQRLLAAGADKTPIRPSSAPIIRWRRGCRTSGKGEARARHFLFGRGEPHRFVGLQAGIVQAARTGDAGQKENFLTFQGENGNLARPLYEFSPRGQTGKMVSNLFPHLADLVDEMCFIHSMTAKSTHWPGGESDVHRLPLDGFPAWGRGRPTRSARRRMTCRRSLPSPIHAACRRRA